MLVLCKLLQEMKDSSYAIILLIIRPESIRNRLSTTYTSHSSIAFEREREGGLDVMFFIGKKGFTIQLLFFINYYFLDIFINYYKNGSIDICNCVLKSIFVKTAQILSL